jgi:uncharacterized protein (TIGR00369 family)
MTDVPDGWAAHTRTSPATASWEPLYARIDRDAFRLGLRVGTRHCNSRGMLHGGVIATLADNACGLSLGVVNGKTGSIVTTSLAIDYIGLAKIGQWLEVAPRVVHAGKSSGVVDALILADGVTVARANAAFRILMPSA